MKKLLILIVIIPLFSNAQQSIHLQDGSFTNGIEETVPTRDVVEVEDGIIVTYSFDCITKLVDPIYNNASILKIDGFALNGHVKEPCVPLHWDSFAIPIGKHGEVSVIDSSYIELPIKIGPARPPLAENEYSSYNIENVPSITPYVGYKPQNLLSRTDVYGVNNATVFNVCVIPVKYNYQDEKVQIYNRIQYKILFVDDNLAKSWKSPKELSDRSITFLNNITINGYTQPTSISSKQVLNRNSVPYRRDYLIITTPKYIEAVEKFAEWKRIMGFNVHIVNNVVWTPQKIHECVYDTEEEYRDLSYVLIVGDHEDVPAKLIESSIYDYYSDYQYGMIFSNYSDIGIGRLPVSSLEEAYIVIEKIIKYEKSPVQDVDFYQRGVNCAYFQDGYWERNSLGYWVKIHPDTYADRRFAQTSEEILRYLTDEHAYNIERVYTANDTVTPLRWSSNYSYGEAIPTYLTRSAGFQWDGDAMDIINKINQGAFYVLHRDHGTYSGWGDPAFSISNISELNNQNKLPVVFSINCQSGDFVGQECFAEAFLKKRNGGCVAIIGATNTSFSGYNDILSLSIFDTLWPTPGITTSFKGLPQNSHTPIYAIGDVLNQAKMTLDYSNYYDKLDYWRYTQGIFHCFGDPSMELYTSFPTEFSNVAISHENGVFEVNTECDDAIISFYNRITGEVVSYKSRTASYSSDSSDMIICVHGHNKIPHISYINNVTYIQNEQIEGDLTIDSGVVKIGSKVTDEKAYGPVYFTEGKISISGNLIEINGETNIEIGAELEINNK